VISYFPILLGITACTLLALSTAETANSPLNYILVHYFNTPILLSTHHRLPWDYGRFNPVPSTGYAYSSGA